MAVITKPVKLILTFIDVSGKDVVFIFNYADKTAETSDIVALMESIIANGSIFNDVPVSIKSAKFSEAVDTIIDLDGE